MVNRTVSWAVSSTWACCCIFYRKLAFIFLPHLSFWQRARLTSQRGKSCVSVCLCVCLLTNSLNSPRTSQRSLTPIHTACHFVSKAKAWQQRAAFVAPSYSSTHTFLVFHSPLVDSDCHKRTRRLICVYKIAIFIQRYIFSLRRHMNWNALFKFGVSHNAFRSGFLNVARRGRSPLHESMRTKIIQKVDGEMVQFRKTANNRHYKQQQWNCEMPSL